MISMIDTRPNNPEHEETHAQRRDGHVEEASATESDDSSLESAQQNGNTKKRKRPTKISCELCKARKVKCDRQEPSCGWCSRNNRVCVYKERKRPGLRASYGIELEDKINRMEAMLHLLGRRVEDHITTGVCHQPSAASGQFDGHHIQDQQSLDTPMTQHSWNSHAPASYTQLPQPKPADLAPAQTLSRTGSHDTAVGGIPITSPPRSHPGKSLPEDLPPYESLCNLVDMYFKHVNTWSPILDRKATFDILFESQNISEGDRVVLHAIVAVTLRFSKDPRISPEASQRYHAISKQKVQLYALEHPNMEALQALALVTVDAYGTSNDAQSWNLLALLARNIVQLGLGFESSVYLKPTPESSTVRPAGSFTLPQPENWIQDEGRRRIFWLTYIIDRYATISSHLDFVLDEQETDRPLPCRYDLFSKNQPVETRWFRSPDSTDVVVDNPENLGSFSYHCEVLRILSQIHRFLRNPIDIDSVAEVHRWQDTYRELDSKLSTWLAHLPGEYGKISQLCHSDPGSRVSNWIMIHAAFVTSVIRLHSAAAYPTSRSGIFQPSSTAVQRCLDAVESLRRIAQDVVDGDMLDLLGPPFAFSLWTSGRVLLVHAATTDRPVDPVIDFLTTTLASMGQYWEVARRWAGALTRLVREGRQAEDDEHGRHNAPLSSSKTYTAMRRSAHHLASLTCRRPRSVIDPTSTRLTTPAEFEYIDVFDWFNYPRLPAEKWQQQQQQQRQQTTYPQLDTAGAYTGTAVTTGVFATPNPDSDWLSFKQHVDFKPPYE